MKYPYRLIMKNRSGKEKISNAISIESAKRNAAKKIMRYPTAYTSYKVVDVDGNVVATGINEASVPATMELYPRNIYYEVTFVDPIGKVHVRMDRTVVENASEYNEIMSKLSVPNVRILKA